METTLYRINEVFASLQGEGVERGVPSVFVRFAGCNLRGSCWKYGGCDTEFDYYYVTDVDTLVNDIRKYKKIVHIILTGGEPSLQFLNPLVSKLYNLGYKITLETNGTIYAASAIEYIDLYSCAPKFCNFQVEYNSKATDSIIRTISIGKRIQVKFVVGTEDDIKFSKKIIKDIISKCGLPFEEDYLFSFHFQPHETNNYYEEETISNYKSLIKKYLNDQLLNNVEAKWGLQTHKILGIS